MPNNFAVPNSDAHNLLQHTTRQLLQRFLLEDFDMPPMAKESAEICVKSTTKQLEIFLAGRKASPAAR